jgi:hypothetical protein
MHTTLTLRFKYQCDLDRCNIINKEPCILFLVSCFVGSCFGVSCVWFLVSCFLGRVSLFLVSTTIRPTFCSPIGSTTAVSDRRASRCEGSSTYATIKCNVLVNRHSHVGHISIPSYSLCFATGLTTCRVALSSGALLRRREASRWREMQRWRDDCKQTWDGDQVVMAEYDCTDRVTNVFDHIIIGSSCGAKR